MYQKWPTVDYITLPSLADANHTCATYISNKYRTCVTFILCNLLEMTSKYMCIFFVELVWFIVECIKHVREIIGHAKSNKYSRNFR